MAKNTKTGLGRGLDSLLGGSVEEAAPAETIKEEPEAVVQEAEEAPVKKQTKPTIAKKPIEQKKPVEQVNQTETDEKDVPTAKENLAKELPQSAEAPLQPVEKRKIFDDDDDHVVIKEVKAREVKKPASQKSKEDETAAPLEPSEGSPINNEVPIDLVQPNPDQPRTFFNKEEIEELAASIEKDGLLQPVLVRPIGKHYQIIAGERRWQACKSAGMKTISIMVREANDDKALELALVENIQRSDLNPIEEAYGYRRLMERGGLTQSEVAETVSKGRSTITNALRLLELPEEAQQLLFEEKISAGHARAILSIPHQAGREKLTDRMVNEKISVREAEMLARLYSGVPKKEGESTRIPTPKSFKSVAKELRKVLNVNVKVKTVQGKNKIEIEFQDEDELERLFEMISSKEMSSQQAEN